MEGETARIYCSSCHAFPDASLLDSLTWQKNVLPVMGELIGIKYFNGKPFEDLHSQPSTNAFGITNEQSIISLEDWQKIINYYKDSAPPVLPSQGRPPLNAVTGMFYEKTLLPEKGNFPTTSFVKIDPGNKCIYAANGYDSSLTIYSSNLQKVKNFKLKGILVDMQFATSLNKAGKRNGILTNIGIMNPNDLETGSADTFDFEANGSKFFLHTILDSMPRPVQTTGVDLNKDGKEDYLICGFGNKTGALYWMKNAGDNTFQQQILRPLPGAIKTYIVDFNHDGLPDIIALMAQAQEGIYLFTNKGDGTFDTKELLTFPPVYGSSYFELDDFNKDGYPDILYTCGDNADFTFNELKSYHGLYIFLNDGKNNFTQKYFFPVHGCYKAIAKDFDLDGDLDIAAISYFPDMQHQPQESFVYLENKGDYRFSPFTIKEPGENRWLTMDTGDLDGDGDIDIVLGSFVPPIQNDKMQVQKKENIKPALMVLYNNTKN